MTERAKHLAMREASRLWGSDRIEESREILDIYIECLFQLIIGHKLPGDATNMDHDAQIVCQMIFSKLCNLKEIVNGFEYTSSKGDRLDRVVDPTVVGVLVRNIYETVCAFNVIFRQPDSNDEKETVYGLWVHAGLKYRQRFGEFLRSDREKQKLVDERGQLESIFYNIENTELYKTMDLKQQDVIRRKLKEKDFKVLLTNGKVKSLNWHDTGEIMGLKKHLLGEMYTYLSLFAHPSNVSVFQFRALFNKQDPEFYHTTSFQLKYVFMLVSSFIADFIKVFPNVQQLYNILDLKTQLVINFYNIFARGEEYSINDAHKF